MPKLDEFVCIAVALVALPSCRSREKFPKGHLQPLGSHAEPGFIEERETVPTPQEFWNDYVKVSKAVVFRGMAKVSPSFGKWTDKYLKDTFGDLEVRLEGKKEKSSGIPIGDVYMGRDTIRNFVNTYHEPNSNKYVVSELPTPMYSDILVPSFLSCGSFSKHLVEIDLWMSGGGTSSILHKDAFNAMNCLYNGTKEWKFIDYKYESKIYKAWEPEDEIGGYSHINPEQVDLIKYPDLIEVPWSKTTVNAGDCLYLPKSMYHQVKSFGTNNLAVAILFSRFDKRENLSFVGCDKPVVKPLSEYNIDWQYPGYGEMTMGNNDLHNFKSWLVKAAKSGLAFADVKKIFAEFASEYPSHGATPEMFFGVFGLKVDDGPIPYESVRNLTKSKVRKLALMLLKREPSNTGALEYHVIAPNKILDQIPLLLKQERVQRQDFVNMYTSILGGTKSFADAFFDTLAGKGNSNVAKEEVMAKIQIALDPYYAWQKESEVGGNDPYSSENDGEKKKEEALKTLSSKLTSKSEEPNSDDIKKHPAMDSTHNHVEL